MSDEMKIATWNVNSIGVRLPHVLDWLDSNRVEVLCLQETKCVDEKFPREPFESRGYEVATFGQPTYNGVAILSRFPLEEIERGFPGEEPEAQRRLLAATIAGPRRIRVIDVYIPNGSEVGSEKYQYKLGWLAALKGYVEKSGRDSTAALLCGDFNIAPEDRDLHDPALWEGKILCSDAERAALEEIRQTGWEDLFRRHHAEAGHFSWWDYRAGGFRRNHGLRIDHVWATPPLAAYCVDAWIDRIPRALEKPSDHAPVVAEFVFG